MTAKPRHRPLIRSAYLSDLLTPQGLSRTIKQVVQRLRPLRHDFDSIAFRGNSGSLVAPAVALRLRKPLILVRRGEDCHSHLPVEGNLATERYAIIDDLVSTGTTVQSIVKAITAKQRVVYDPQTGEIIPSPTGVPVLVALYGEWASHDEIREYGPCGTIRTVGCR